MTNKPNPEATSRSLAHMDKLLEHRSRLGTCVLLADAHAVSFSNLRKLLKETDGNLGAHLRKLEDAGYVTVDKRFENRKPVSWYRLEKEGKKALKDHLKPFVEQGHINKWAIPSQIAVVTEIPKTSVGKLDKKRIRQDIVQWQASNSAFLSTL